MSFEQMHSSFKSMFVLLLDQDSFVQHAQYFIFQLSLFSRKILVCTVNDEIMEFQCLMLLEYINSSLKVKI